MSFVETQTRTRWYRGCGDAHYQLIPSLYRHPKLKGADRLFKQEMDILKRFRLKSGPYVQTIVPETDNLRVLFVMQHFGIPTRLLDWTENPYIALYFALTDAQYTKTKGGPVYRKDVAIWALDPVEWNKRALEFDPSPGIISALDEELLNGYMPGPATTHHKAEPVAVDGVYNSPRIAAQRGVFTLFGTSNKPMEESYVENNYPQDSLVKLIVGKSHIKNLLEGLMRIGITDSVVYPDLTGLAKELKRQFGYWV